MKKSKILVLLTIVALFLAIPAVALAQAPPLARFAGTAMVDDAAVPDGTMVSAMIGDVEVASGRVSGGNYLLTVVQPPGDDFVGASIMFMIGDMMAGESSTWAAGLSEPLDLTAMAVAAGETVMVSLYETWPSGVSGMAMLTEIGEETRVKLYLNPGAVMSGGANVHSGSCDAPGDVMFSLMSMMSMEGGMMDMDKMGMGMMDDKMDKMGMEMMMLDATLASLRDGNHVINVPMAGHEDISTACGAIPNADGMAMMPALPAGPAGADGAAGEKGATGAIGPRGGTGAKGDTGAAGAAGAAGPAGAAGADGGAGPSGPAGVAGAEGPAGAAGANGAAGAMGPAGAAGGGTLGVIALIIAIVAVVIGGAAIVMGRSS